MTRIALIVTILALAACGIDGEPQPPVKKSGAWVSGDAYVAVETKL